MKDIKKRLRNRGTLIALGSQLLIVISIIYYYVTGQLIPTSVLTDLTLLGGAVLVTLTVLGVLNNPTSGTGFKDDDDDPYN